ncbi:VWA domain-containing protein [Streptomyces sp. NPDC048282]|uniref:VWA domain-containing protein n=1 Tax=unclassified Streptomyces TaxID=2593676 RepID=UPI003716ABEA
MPGTLRDRTHALVTALGTAGVRISAGEHADALAALSRCDLRALPTVRTALRATLIKDAGHLALFDTLFPLFMAAPEPSAPAPGGPLAAMTDNALTESIAAELRTPDRLRRRLLAGEAVRRWAGVEPGRPVGGEYYVTRTLRRIGLTRPTEADGAQGRAAREIAVRDLRQAVESEVRRLLAADQGPAALARRIRTTLPADTDLMAASDGELAALQGVVERLARVAVARRRHRRRPGRIDQRRTLRRAQRHGGVPVDLVRRPRRPPRHRLVVLADVSGSASAFAGFALSFLQAVTGADGAARCFVFVEGVAEITGLLRHTPTIRAVREHVRELPELTRIDGHSDYGHVLASFRSRHGGTLDHRTTLVVLGDARTNYHAPGTEDLAALARRAGQVWWLNPEPRSDWDTGDSAMSAYRACCDLVAECRTARQLSQYLTSATAMP